MSRPKLPPVGSLARVKYDARRSKPFRDYVQASLPAQPEWGDVVAVVDLTAKHFHKSQRTVWRALQSRGSDVFLSWLAAALPGRIWPEGLDAAGLARELSRRVDLTVQRLTPDEVEQLDVPTAHALARKRRKPAARITDKKPTPNLHNAKNSLAVIRRR